MPPDFCPTCGQTLPPDLPGEHDFTTMEKRILEIVRTSGAHGLSSEQLFERLYSGDPNGGPLTGKRSMYVIVCGLNKKLAEIDWSICAARGGPGSPKTYKLVPYRKVPR